MISVPLERTALYAEPETIRNTCFLYSWENTERDSSSGPHWDVGQSADVDVRQGVQYLGRGAGGLRWLWSWV